MNVELTDFLDNQAKTELPVYRDVMEHQDLLDFL